MSAFAGFEDVWADRLGTLRNVVRQHVVAQQLGEHLEGVHTVVDIGCGQGTQAIMLAQAGLEATGVDPSPELLQQMTDAARERAVQVRPVLGDLAGLDEVLGGQQFDLVCAHGLLMYLPDAFAALDVLARRVAPGGLLSFTVRNGDALAYRPGARGEYTQALAAFDSTKYVNELGVHAQAHRRHDIEQWSHRAGLHIAAWYGVRVLTDGLPASATAEDIDVSSCLEAEVQAGRRDPYRHLGSQLHFIVTTA